jgi:hypothetical protein
MLCLRGCRDQTKLCAQNVLGEAKKNGNKMSKRV